MTPDRWRQVTEIFHAAIAHTPATRDAFLADVCRQDASLRADVDALLDAHQRAGASDEVPAVGDVLPHFEPGTTLGPYRIEELIGVGGMGEVYRATDTRLHRVVAIKVLQPGLAADPHFHARFEREARALAALNHPNIGAIHGLEDVDGARALVLEFVEGPTLAERLGSGKLPLDEALAIARQITLALAAAHEKGIVHRDLKPANIKIAPDGVVKVLDFGIAKAAAAGAALPEATPAQPTREGVVLGTAAYMSPEQARGRPVDKRTDIWAFGCVLFEMLTGRRAFEADTVSDGIAKILEGEPDWSALPAAVPDSIQRLLRRCLKKDAADRLHDIADARPEIADASAPQTTRAPAAPAGTRRERWLWVGLAIASATAIAAWLIGPRGGGTQSVGQPVELGISFPENFVPAHGIAVSPDGRHVAAGVYDNIGRIWLHFLETSETRPVAGAERGSTPFWSPDSSHLGFFAGGALRKKDLATGTVSEICKTRAVPYGGTWNTDGLVVFATGGRLFQVPADGGEGTPLVLNDQPKYVGFPQFLPDGRHFIFYAWGPEGGTVNVASLDSGAVKRLVDSNTAGVFAAPDRLLYVRGTSLMAQGLDVARLELKGDAQVVANAAGPGMLTLENSLGAISASATGVLAYTTERGGRPGQLTWFDGSGRAQRSMPQPDDGVEYLNPAISPDGGLVAVNRMDPQTGNWDIWIVDVERNVPTRLTSDPAVDADPIWSPDGTAIVYSSDRGGRLGLYRQSIGVPGPAEQLLTLETPRILLPSDWSVDGKYIMYYQAGPRPWSVWALPLSGDRKPLLVLEQSYGARFSPDGRWITYSSFEGGSFETYVQRFPTPAAKQRISEGGGVHPRWTSGGRELVYWAIPGGLNAVTLTPSASGLQVGRPRPIVQAPVLSLIDGRTHYDVTRDGKRFLVRQPAGPQGPGIRVILNWTARLKR